MHRSNGSSELIPQRSLDGVRHHHSVVDVLQLQVATTVRVEHLGNLELVDG